MNDFVAAADPTSIVGAALFVISLIVIPPSTH
jgi:preprotein translocase subunit Sec61beta